MTITKETLVEKIIIEEQGIIFFRERIKIMEDGIELSTYDKDSSLAPGQDLSGLPPSVVAICNVVWTDAVISAYKGA